MLSSKDATLVYETLMMFPGMNDNVKIPLTLKRKAILMLTKLIDQGISKEAPNEGILSVMDVEVREELKAMAQGLLEKAALNELNERLGSLNLK